MHAFKINRSLGRQLPIRPPCRPFSSERIGVGRLDSKILHVHGEDLEHRHDFQPTLGVTLPHALLL